jgi:tol-pal system protein YbgF
MNAQRSLRFTAIALLFAGLTTLPAQAANKDMIQLQTQMQQLQDAIARLQQSNDERMGVLKDLVQQTADSVNRMSVTVDGLKLAMQNQQDASAAKSEQLSGQIQSLNDSLDELKARMERMEKSMGTIQSQQQSTNAILGSLPGTNPASTQPAPLPSPGASGAPVNAAPIPVEPTATGVPTGPSAGDLYKTAYGDYMTGKYPLAASEFNDLIKAHPDDNLSGNAYFYLGEIDLRTQKPSAAVKSYDRVLEQYPDNQKIPSAHLHKGEALISLKQTDAGVRELHALIQRFPNSPEAAQAKARLASLQGRR